MAGRHDGDWRYRDAGQGWRRAEDTDPAVHPRTVVGTKADGSVVLFEVDGRQPGFSEGLNYIELGEMPLELGVVNALNLDGGGSATFVARLPGETERKCSTRRRTAGNAKRPTAFCW